MQDDTLPRLAAELVPSSLEKAVDLMRQALDILDAAEEGLAACHLSMAIELLGATLSVNI
ncbi:MAG: hypothetical protein ABW184_11425 [Sphingobium sp.]